MYVPPTLPALSISQMLVEGRPCAVCLCTSSFKNCNDVKQQKRVCSTIKEPLTATVINSSPPPAAATNSPPHASNSPPPAINSPPPITSYPPPVTKSLPPWTHGAYCNSKGNISTFPVESAPSDPDFKVLIFLHNPDCKQLLNFSTAKFHPLTHDYSMQTQCGRPGIAAWNDAVTKVWIRRGVRVTFNHHGSKMSGGVDAYNVANDWTSADDYKLVNIDPSIVCGQNGLSSVNVTQLPPCMTGENLPHAAEALPAADSGPLILLFSPMCRQLLNFTAPEYYRLTDNFSSRTPDCPSTTGSSFWNDAVTKVWIRNGVTVTFQHHGPDVPEYTIGNDSPQPGYKLVDLSPAKPVCGKLGLSAVNVTTVSGWSRLLGSHL